MKLIRLVAMAMVALGIVTPAWAQVASAPAVVDYDTFMQQDVQGRIRVFNQVTPENRAELVQTQIKRWLEKNRARLTPEQLKVMDENLAFVTADRYREPMNDERRAAAQQLERRNSAVFTRDDIAQAITIYATYIPKAVSPDPLAAQDAAAIRAAKQVIVQQLAPAAPRLPFEVWLQDVTRVSTATWEVNDCGEQSGDPAQDKGRDFPMCAEVAVILSGQRELHVALGVGTFHKGVVGLPHFRSAHLKKPDGSIQWIDRLLDIPSVIR